MSSATSPEKTGSRWGSIQVELPIELTTIILSKLPVKSLLRYRSVCKIWCSLIDNHTFRTLHYLNASSEIDYSSSLILLPDDINQMLILQDYHLASSEHEQPFISFNTSRINLPFKGDWHFVNSCMGLCYLISHSIRLNSPDLIYTMCIYNPAIQEYAYLPDLPSFDFDCIATGFGFEPSVEEYKVVVQTFKMVEGGRASQVLVHTLSSNEWRIIGESPRHGYLHEYTIGCLNGCIHWLSYSVDIVAFDLKSETFGIIPLPPKLRILKNDCCSLTGDIRLGIIGGCFWIADCHCNSDGNEYEIWVLKEYNVKDSWTKQYVIRKNILDEMKLWSIAVISFGKDGKLVLLCDFASLFTYDIETEKFLPFQAVPIWNLNQDPTELTWFGAHPYVESLISPMSVTKSIKEG